MTLLDVLKWFFSLPAVWGAIFILAALGVMGLLKKKN